MPTLDGLSLLGFMDEDDALAYMRTQCAFDDATDDALRKLWRVARERLATPMAKAGQPSILDIPQKHRGYLEAVRKNPRYGITVGHMEVAFKQVEIAPLLAFQFHVHTDEAHTPMANVGAAPTMAEMLQRCLPLDVEPMRMDWQRADAPNHHRLIVTSSSINMVLFEPKIGDMTTDKVMPLYIGWGPNSPLVQVVRFEGRCYLKNGYHRAYQLEKRRVQYMPCILLEATRWEDVVGAGAVTFPRELLGSANPPTCGHFAQGRAHPVRLPLLRRVIEIEVKANLLPAEA